MSAGSWEAEEKEIEEIMNLRRNMRLGCPISRHCEAPPTPIPCAFSFGYEWGGKKSGYDGFFRLTFVTFGGS